MRDSYITIGQTTPQHPGPSKGCPMDYPTLPIGFHWAPLGWSRTWMVKPLSYGGVDISVKRSRGPFEGFKAHHDVLNRVIPKNPCFSKDFTRQNQVNHYSTWSLSSRRSIQPSLGAFSTGTICQGTKMGSMKLMLA